MILLRLFAVLVLTACSTAPIQNDIPALLSNASAETRLELEQAMSAALDGVEITIAIDAFTQFSVLTIERGMHRSIGRSPEMGRDLGQPEHFQLMIDGPQCVLVHQRTELRWLLNRTTCEPE